MLSRARTATPGSLSGDPVVPLVPRRRIAGLPHGETGSIRRGGSYDAIGSRLYQPGDDPRRIDRHASARLSAFGARDVLIVREYHAEERLTVGLAVDPASTMSLYPPALPWLHKPTVAHEVERIVAASVQRARGRLIRLGLWPLDEPLRALGPGSIVFAVSDFLRFPVDDVWGTALTRRWDVVPVVVQDPTWEQSFPDVAGVCLPLADARGAVRPTLLTRREVERRRWENEARYGAIVDRLEELGLEPVLLDSADPDSVLEALLAWADARRSAVAWSA